MISLAFWATVINYLDRQTLSVAAPVLRDQFHMSNVDYSRAHAGESVPAVEGTGQLHLKAFQGEARLLVRGVEEDSRVAARTRQRLDFELEVPEAGAAHRAGIEQVRPRPVGHQIAVYRLPGALVLARAPSVQVALVEQIDPTIVGGHESRGRGRSHTRAPRQIGIPHDAPQVLSRGGRWRQKFARVEPDTFIQVPKINDARAAAELFRTS